MYNVVFTISGLTRCAGALTHPLVGVSCDGLLAVTESLIIKSLTLRSIFNNPFKI
jgi:hypothetical protein